MTNINVEEIFHQSETILKGHFLLTSGLHSPVYWEKFRVLQYPNYTEQLCRLIVDHFRSHKTQLVAGPPTGGIILAFETARQLGVRDIFAEKENTGERSFRRDFNINPGERVLIVDDILTTGSSIREVMAAVSKQGGIVVGIGVLVNRSEQEVEFGVPFFSCYRSTTLTYPPQDCPLCAVNISLVKPGSSQKPPS